ncbi:uncharacterized protein G2W53_039225 [Senna tora]|uniref:Uncharacterized protein n=1 Tax=Senna tora TaxID=362788 RepID=A0A834W7T3_9FABA|nr:uncharacterized protein G2W53_039225 [Senna tora]
MALLPLNIDDMAKVTRGKED